MCAKKAGILLGIYKKLFAQFGKQHWWPAKSRFEVIIGAILTQNTSWSNVEKAIANLRKNKALTPTSLRNIPKQKLASLIKPTGYFNIKAKRLKNFIIFLFCGYNGNLNKMAREDMQSLRGKLLNVNGIGPETADSILLYAFNKPIFVVDAYTKRILSRHHLIDKNADYNLIQSLFINNLKRNAQMFNEYHALFVRLAKEFCRARPLCGECPLNAHSFSAPKREFLNRVYKI